MSEIIEFQGRASDQGRFESIVQPQFEALYGAASRLAATSADAEDLVQEVCLKAFIKWSDLELIEHQRPGPMNGWGYEVRAEYRNSDYDDLNPKRTEDLNTLRAGITKMLTRDWQLLVEYLYADNDSSDSTFSYQRNRLTVAMMRIF